MPNRRRRTSGKGRVIFIVIVLVLFALALSLRGIAGFWTDYLWFESLDLTSVFTGILGAKIALAVIFTAAFFVLCFASLTVADRLAPKFRPQGPEDDMLDKYHATVGRRAGLLRAGVSLLLGLVAGVGMSSEWNQWLLFRNGGSFGITDATFDTDVGFYVFKLPFYSTIVSWLFASGVIILIVTVVAHYLNGGIRLQAPVQRVTPQVKAHISVLLGLLALVKAADYWLQRYELTTSTRGTVDGATYTDVNAQLPAIYLLLFIAVLSFFLFIYNIWRRGWVLPVVAVGLWALVSVVAGVAYPAFIQRFTVEPAESSVEAPYISNNIEATRQAFGLDEVTTEPFDYTQDQAAGTAAVNENPGTIRNIRLLDPEIVLPTYQRLQSQVAAYQFNDLDVDRYQVQSPDGSFNETQVVLGARDLSVNGIPQQSWEGRHVAYTHGYGVALAPANATTPEGRPKFLIQNVPTEFTPPDATDVTLDRPQMYYGEALPGYAITNAERDEIDFSVGGQTQSTVYDGSGGVVMDSWLKKAAFAARFGDWNLLISNFVTPESRIVFQRDVQGAGPRDRPVPELRRRSVPGADQRAHRVHLRRLHDHGPLPQRPAGRHRQHPAGGRPVRSALQLRAQLHQGRRRHLRRHREPLRDRRRRPDRRGLPAGLPRPVEERRRVPRGAAGALALPRGPVPGADQRLEPLPHRRPGGVLRAQHRVAGGPGPWLGADRGHRWHDADHPRPGRRAHPGVAHRPVLHAVEAPRRGSREVRLVATLRALLRGRLETGADRVHGGQQRSGGLRQDHRVPDARRHQHRRTVDRQRQHPGQRGGVENGSLC